MNMGVCFKVVLVCLVSSIALTGCKRPKKGGPSGPGPDGRVTAVNPIGFDEYRNDTGPGGMGVRSDDGELLNTDLEVIYFAYDSSQVTEGERYKADSVAGILQNSPGARLEIEGHCDEQGSREYNLTLGESRALAVREYLIDSGIAGDRIQTKSYGEENPAVFGHDDESHRLNRRAGFLVFN